MSNEAPNRIAEVRKLKGWTQQQLAEAVGAHWITISKLERGKLPLSFEWAERLGAVLGVGEYGVFKLRNDTRPVFVDGIITAGGLAKYYKDEKGNEDFEEYHVELDLTRKAQTNWFAIDSDGFFPFFQSGDLVQVEWVSPSEIDLYLNRLCLVDTEYDVNNKGELRLGFLVNGTKRNRYNLNILSGAPIKDLDLSGVAVVTMALFNPAVWGRRGEADT